MNSELLKFKELIDQTQYEQATKYLNKYKQNFDTGLYEYNQAYLSYKQDNFVAARLWIEKSLRSGNYSPRSLSALGEIKGALGVQYLEQAEGPSDYWHQAFFLLPQGPLFSIFLSFILVWVVFAFKVKNIYVTVMSFIFLVLISLAGVYTSVTKYQVLLTKEHSYYNGPSTIFDVEGTLPPGLKLILTDDEENGWAQIIAPRTIEGWIEKKNIQKL